MRVSNVRNVDNMNVVSMSANASLGTFLSGLLSEETRRQQIGDGDLMIGGGTLVIQGTPMLHELVDSDDTYEVANEVVSRLRATNAAIRRNRPTMTRRLIPMRSPPTFAAFHEAFGVGRPPQRHGRFSLVASIRQAASTLPLATCRRTSQCGTRVEEGLRRATTTQEREQIGESVLAEATREDSRRSVVSRVLDSLSSSRGDAYSRACAVVFKVLTSRYSRPFRSQSSAALPDQVSQGEMDWTRVVESGESCSSDLKLKLERMKDLMSSETQSGISSFMTSAVRALHCLELDDICEMPPDLWLRIRVQILHDIERCILTKCPGVLRCNTGASHTDQLLNQLSEDATLERGDPLLDVMQQVPGTPEEFMRNVFNNISHLDASVPVISDPNDARSRSLLHTLRFDINENGRNFIGSSPIGRMVLLSAPIARLTTQDRNVLGSENLRTLIHEAHDSSFSVAAMTALPHLLSRITQHAREDPQRRNFTPEEADRLRLGNEHWLRPKGITPEDAKSDSSELGASASTSATEPLTCNICLSNLTAKQHEALQTYAAQWDNHADLPKQDIIHLESEDLRANYCGHYFHRECLERWNARCAVCRAPWSSESEDEDEDERGEACRVS